MKTKLTLLALVAISTLLTSCASTGGSTSSNTTSTGVKPYPLKVCLITDNDLNSMGDEQTHVWNGQQLKFCCEACFTKFQKNPAKYLAKLPKA
jgi:hypothetical protein